jgi:alpha-glucosidase
LTRADPWWRSGVIYQVYPRSFADSDGDGIGDLKGIVEHLEHLEWLGVSGIWLSPVTVSPNADWGYDVADYRNVQPEYGTLDDLDVLISEARRRGIRVLMDLVPNHTSDRHPWFVDARASRAAHHRDWYVWADPKPDGSPPNNWASCFGGPAWTLDEATGQYYLHNFLPEQPDLNWWNDDVRSEFDDVLRFWFDRGVAGFRIDVCHGIVKDAELRDNPVATPDDTFVEQMFGQRWVYNANRPEAHDVMRRWRRIADSYEEPRLLLGETNVEELEALASFYGNGSDELNLAFNFPFIDAPFDSEKLRAVYEASRALMPAGAWPVWAGSNHDVSHMATRWANGDPAKIRVALVMLLCLRGTAVLYEGDEIGMTDARLRKEDIRDPVGVRFWPAYKGRDPMRTPMQWSAGPGAGFTSGRAQAWLPIGDADACNVETQRKDPSSVLALARDTIVLRREIPELGTGDQVELPGPHGAWVWRRGDKVAVALNLSSDGVTVECVRGQVAICTNRSRDGETATGGLELAGWEAAVVLLD